MKTELLETLVAFHRSGSITEASTALRITQSAASKRLSQLESIASHNLFERQGRNLALTQKGLELAQQAQVALSSLRALLSSPDAEKQSFTLGISDSILSSWGAPLLSDLQRAQPKVHLEVNAHRSPVIVDKLNLGQYDLGICAGTPTCPQSLIQEHMFDEPIVLIGKGKRIHDRPIITIEKTASTWKSIEKACARCGYRSQTRIQSFSAAANLALHGLGIALVPCGIASSMRSGRARSTWMSKTPISRPISVVYKKSLLQSESFQEMRNTILASAKQIAF
ncbi:MAG: LysR family transcriptional regulator [Verrucomicrobiota bacterium]